MGVGLTKPVTIAMFHVFKILTKDIESIKRDTKLLEVKTTMCEGVNRLDAEEDQ